MSATPPPLAPYEGPPAPLTVYQPAPAPTVRGAMKDELGRIALRGTVKAGTYLAIGVGLYIAGRVLWERAREWWASWKSRASRVEVREVPTLPDPPVTVAGPPPPSPKVARARGRVTYSQAVRAQPFAVRDITHKR